MNALRPHRLSSKSLDLGINHGKWDEGVDLHEFSALEELSIDLRMLKGDDEDYTPPGKIFPPSLREVTFRELCCVTQMTAVMLQKVSEAELPDLHRLTFKRER